VSKNGANIAANGKTTINEFWAKSKYGEVQNSFSFKSDVPKEQERDELAFGFGANREVVPFFTEGECFPNFLQRVAEQSPTRLTCINNKVNYVIGDGFVVNGGKHNTIFAKFMELFDLQTRDEREAREFIGRKNANGENLYDVTKDILKDYLTTGNAYILMSKVTIAGRDIFMYKRLNVEHVLRVKKQKDTETEMVAINREFEKGNVNIASNKTKYYPVYPEWGRSGDDFVTVIHLRNLLSGREIYGLPTAITSTYWQMAEAKAQEYNVDIIDNRFLAALFIESVEPTVRSQADVNKTFKRMIDRWTTKGKEKDKGGGLVYREVQNKDMFSNVHEFKNDWNTFGFFDGLGREAERQIIKSEQWHPALNNVFSRGSLGGDSKEIRDALKLVTKGFIVPMRNTILSKVVNVILFEAGFENVFLTFADSEDSLLGDLDVRDVLTVNELRRYAGLGNLDTGDEMVDGEGDLPYYRVVTNKKNNSSDANAN